MRKRESAFLWHDLMMRLEVYLKDAVNVDFGCFKLDLPNA